MKAYKVKIEGDVQGVGYRYSATGVAQKLGLSGWVKNDLDGGVLAVIQGDEESCNQFIEWAHEGPPMAEVEKVEVEEIEIDENLKGLQVK